MYTERLQDFKLTGEYMKIRSRNGKSSKASRPSIKRKAACVALCAFSACLLTACGAKTDTAIIVAGSTSVQPFAEILAEEYALVHPDQDVDIQGGGSSAGITAAESGIADIGMSSRALKEAERGLWSVEIAKDSLAIVVNPRNPIENLTMEQVRQIYAAEVTKWSELGGTDSTIHVITREEGSGTRSAFEELVMGMALITPKAIVQDSNGAVKQLVADDPNAIGFVSLGLVDSSIKAMLLGGVAASAENVMNGRYTLYRPFLFVSRGQPEGLSKQFIDFVLSEEGQRVLQMQGLIPARGGEAE